MPSFRRTGFLETGNRRPGTDVVRNAEFSL
jgi:hypothetical protein